MEVWWRGETNSGTELNNDSTQVQNIHQTSSRTLVSSYKAVRLTNNSSRNIWLTMKKELPPTGANGSWLLLTDCCLLQGGNVFCCGLGRQGRIFSSRPRWWWSRDGWALKEIERKRKSSQIHCTNRVVPHRLQRRSRLSSDGFPAQSGDSRIDSVPLFNPLSGLFRDSQEACGYLISHFISSHQTEQLQWGGLWISVLPHDVHTATQSHRYIHSNTQTYWGAAVVILILLISKQSSTVLLQSWSGPDSLNDTAGLIIAS